MSEQPRNRAHGYLLCSMLSLPLSIMATPMDTPLGQPELSPERALLTPISKSSAGKQFARIIELIKNGQAKEALPLARKAVSESPRSPIAHEVLGTVLAIVGKRQEAIEQLNRSVELAPRRASALSKIGNLYLVDEQYAKAVDYLLRAHELMPDNPINEERLGIAYERLGRFDEAIERLEHVIALSPDDERNRLRLADLYNRRGQPAKARDLLTPLADKDRLDPLGLSILARSLLTLHETDAAATIIDRLIAKAPDSAQGYHLKGILELRRNQPVRAEQQLLKAVAKAPDSATSHFLLADTQARNKHYEQALENYEKARALGLPGNQVDLAIATLEEARGRQDAAKKIYAALIHDPKALPATLDTIGQRHLTTGRLDEAEAVYRTFKHRFPKNPLGPFRLGRVLAARKHYPEAIKELEKADDMAPGDANILLSLGLTYQRQGQKSRAIEALERAIQAAPKDATSRFALATIYDESGEADKSERLYRRIVADHPDHAAALNNLAVLLNQRGQSAEALKFARRALKRLPDNPMLLDTLGWIEFRLGRLDEAHDRLAKAARAMPGSPDVLYHLAAVEEALGKHAQARKHVDKALSVDAAVPFHDRQAAEGLLEKIEKR